MATYDEMYADLERQEQENDNRFKAATHAYFESKASIRAAKNALRVAQENYSTENQPKEEKAQDGKLDAKSITKN